MTLRERLRPRNLEQYNSPHFLKGAVTALAGWLVFMLWGPILSMGILAAVTACASGLFLLRWPQFLSIIALLISLAAGLVLFGQFGPLGFAFIATMVLAVVVEFWQKNKGDQSDGFDWIDLVFDFSGWLYLAGVIEAWEWLAV